MKKILIALLALLLCFAFVACRKQPNDTTGVDPSDSNQVDGPETTKKPAFTKEPEITDTDTLAVGQDDGSEFGPVNQ